MPLVGYRYFTDKGLQGEPGLYYDYVTGANGVFIRAENRFITAQIRVAEADIRGLQPVITLAHLKYGKIPWSLYHLAISQMMVNALIEQYFAIIWRDGYYLVRPDQEGTPCSCHYVRVPDTVMEFHSHALMSSFFSGIDNSDEVSMAIYAVVGRLDQMIPEVDMRLGVYGYYTDLTPNEVFGDVCPQCQAPP